MATTTKKDLIDRIAEATKTRQVLVKAVVQQLFEAIVSEIGRGNRIEFRDFGVFETRTSRPRTAQNPRTLQKVQVPAKRRGVFKPGRLIREGLNGDRRELPPKHVQRKRQAAKGDTRHGCETQR